jgi:ApbE superfamily uncharacterized protein (UPF0280 family)
MRMHAQRRLLDDGRWHFQHGPIDIVLQLAGEPQACADALENTWHRFEQILPELVSELRFLRRPVSELAQHSFSHSVAQRMHRAAAQAAQAAQAAFFSRDGFVTPMAAVAGSVAQELLPYLAQPGVDKAFVNNGGDIALHLQAGESWRVGVVTDLAKALTGMQTHELVVDGAFVINADMPVRGIATSGWQGRSFSFGIADSVTVLAGTAAQADVAATLIANAVNIVDPRIQRRPADSLRDDTDLGARLVTVDVPRLSEAQIQQALQLGLDCAHDMQARGLIYAALLSCQGHAVVAESLECRVE